MIQVLMCEWGSLVLAEQERGIKTNLGSFNVATT